MLLKSSPGVLAMSPEPEHRENEHEAVERQENQDRDVEVNLKKQGSVLGSEI